MRLHRPALPAALALVLATAMPNAVSASPGDPAGTTPTAALAAAETITLITGDQVNVQPDADGRLALTIEETERDVNVSFETYTYEDQTYVIPSDAAPLVPQVLDRELFNVTKLVDYDYHDAVPVIVGYQPAAARTLATTQGATVTAQLPSIDAVAATIDRSGKWWRSVQTQAVGTAGTGTLPGVARVWLDELAEVQLDGSAPLVGAPEAWAAGYDGTGVTVAVLDTGIDAGHPDLQGKVVAARNFTTEADAGDGHGHGTHVAGTIAGTGAASDGRYTGVAPKARLLNAKVCNSAGSCPNSGIILGMEWAAAQGAKVANLSIGGGATDGTDPLSMAVNELTEEHGTLFVIAAGNSGSGDHSVSAPGTADAALTVGAVDKSEQLAGFSGRGPRLGDFAIKPDITAPGVDIAAARGSGTSMGSPVNDHYTRASGTSMATPHVAGAAAIMRQQNPDLSPAEVKAALSATAVPNSGLDVYQQGGGRLDLPAALNTPVLANPSPVNLGYFPYPHDDAAPVSTEVSYTNRTDEPVTIDLALDVKSREGAVPSAQMLAVSPGTLTVEPGGTASATVTLDVSAGNFGLYGGYLTASRGGTAVTRTPVGFYKESERYELRVEGIARDGRPATGGSSFDVMDVADSRRFLETSRGFVDGVGTLRVPPGTYSVMGVVYTYDESGRFSQERVMVGSPEIEVSGDTTLVLDARQANPVTIRTQEPVELLTGVSLGWWRQSEQGGSFAHSFSGLRVPQFAVQTQPVGHGEFEFFTRQRLAGIQDPVLYDLVVPHSGQVPADLTFVADPTQVATLVNRYHSDIAGHEMNEVRHFWRPWSIISVGFTERLAVPQERTEFVVGGDTRYLQRLYAQPAFTGQLSEPLTYYENGERRELSWFRQVVRPGVLDGGRYESGQPTVRNGDVLTVRIQEWVDTEGHYGARDSGVDTTAFRLYENGRLIGQGPRAQGDFPVSPDAAEHRIELDVARKADWWTTSTQTRTVWTVQSGGSTAKPSAVPLLEVDYNVPVDLRNTGAHPKDGQGPLTVGLTVRHQPGADGPAIGGAKLWVSYDDGKSWQQRPTRSGGDGRYEFVLDNRDPAETNGFVALRVEAWDADNNRIEQEVIRAWQLPPAR